MSVSSGLQVSWCYSPNMIKLVDLVSVLEKCISTTYNVDGITNCSSTLSGCFETHFMLTKLCSKTYRLKALAIRMNKCSEWKAGKLYPSFIIEIIDFSFGIFGTTNDERIAEIVCKSGILVVI